MGGVTGGKGASAPAVPDFNAAANQQAQASQQAVNQQTTANRANQTNAFGAGSQWTQGPNGQWTQQSSFGGPLGGAVGGLEQEAASNVGKSMSGDQARDQAIQAAYGQASSRLDPQWNQKEEQTKTQLANQGLDPSSEAYQNAMGDLNRQRNDAYTSAMNSAIGQGTQAGATLFGENQASQMMPYQQLMAMSGLSGQAQTPMAGQAQTPQTLAAQLAAYQGALQNYGIQQQGKNSGMAGMGNLAGGIASAV